MDCERFDKNSMDLLYGELDELTEAATMRHMHHCLRCRGIWGHLRTTRELSTIPQEDPPSDLMSRILEAERIAHRSLPLRERFSRVVSVLAGYAMRPQLAMAALLMLMVSSGLLFVRTQPTTKSSEQMRVVERGAPSTEVRPLRSAHKSIIFGGDTDQVGRAQLIEDEEEMEELPRREPSPAVDEETRKRQRAAYGDAMAAYQQGRYAEAERLFSEIALAGGDQAASAALHEGHAARNGSGCQRAASIYDSVSAKYAGSTIAYEAAWHAASCYRAMGQTARAITHYKKLAESGPFSTRAQSALAELIGSDDNSLPADNRPAPSNETAAASATTPSSDSTAPQAAASPEVNAVTSDDGKPPGDAASNTESTTPVSEKK